MRPAGRLQAAIEVLEEVFERHQPAPMALANWGRAHRFAGSGDRGAIGNLVYDALRCKHSIAARMGEQTPRALALGAAATSFGLSIEEVAALADGAQHAPAPITDEERAGLARELDADAPDYVRGDYPNWMAPAMVQVFGERAALEGAGLAQRAPVDLRVNTLKALRPKVLKALARYRAEPAPLTLAGIRIPATRGPRKQAHVESETGHGKGWFEVQDAGSQIAAALSGAGARDQVADICAGAGGKTLAMAARMQNSGQIYAYDADKRRLRPIFERLKRAGVRNVQVLDGGEEEALRALQERFDVVLVDAPCTGTGTWRRRPDAKWRLKPDNIEQRIEEQRAVLSLGAPLVKPGGRLCYVTCSILAEENTDQLNWFLQQYPDFEVVPYAQVWKSAMAKGGVSSGRESDDGAPGGTGETLDEAVQVPVSADGREDALLLTPASHGTDGFYIATVQRKE